MTSPSNKENQIFLDFQNSISHTVLQISWHPFIAQRLFGILTIKRIPSFKQYKNPLFFMQLSYHCRCKAEKTSLARSATLKDTSWATLKTELKSQNMPDYLFCLESKNDPSVAKTQNFFFFGGGKMYYTALTFLMGETIGVRN